MTEDFQKAAALAAAYLDDVPYAPVWQPITEWDRAWLTDQPLPAAGRPLDVLLDEVRDYVLPYPMGTGHPRFFGWVNSPPSRAGVAVAPLAAALNPSTAGGEHSGVLLERTVVRWLAELVGFPHLPGGGILTSGASMATIIALSAARRRALPEVRETGMYGGPPLTMYLSAEGHSCLRKAAELLGLGSDHLRTVPVDADHRMDVAELRRLVAQDREMGKRPFLVAASAGTVNTGAVDPLDAIAGVAREHGLWFHVDGAYGALGTLVNPAAYAGMAEADSLALDPHKWLGVPVDCGCLLVRDPSAPRDAFSLVPPYLRDDDADDLGWFSEYTPEQTRPFRALRVWATLANLGRDGVTDLVTRTTRLAARLGEMVVESDDFELLAPVTTSIAAFRYTPAEVNAALPVAVQRRGRAFLTGTVLNGEPALRACILHPDTTETDLVVLLDEIRAAAKEL
ncbi:pyridoxal phosphate-dependent decarboxylase family protein [Nonomuraea sp. NPDC050556]|uniref:pyridoxal phosphate-dependent decarboxylase family protein n=1 Tax=Nonomuraea sp. NPDC050556 TaxID=3364369 RepID=UPI00378D59BE